MRLVTRIEPFSAMRIAGVCYGFLGLLLGTIVAIFALVGLFVIPKGSERDASPFLAYLFVPLAVIGLPILYGSMGAVMAGLGAVTYNIASKYVGGIRIEVSGS